MLFRASDSKRDRLRGSLPAPLRAAVERHAHRRRAALRLSRSLLRHYGQVRADSRAGAHPVEGARARLPDRRAPPPGLDLDGRPGARRRRTRPGRALARRSRMGGERGLSPHRGELSAPERQSARSVARDVRAHAHHRPRGGGRVADRDQGRRANGPHRQGNARLHAAAVLPVSRSPQGHRSHRPLAAHGVRAARDSS